jgi:hypothetical protein
VHRICQAFLRPTGGWIEVFHGRWPALTIPLHAHKSGRIFTISGPVSSIKPCSVSCKALDLALHYMVKFYHLWLCPKPDFHPSLLSVSSTILHNTLDGPPWTNGIMRLLPRCVLIFLPLALNLSQGYRLVRERPRGVIGVLFTFGPDIVVRFLQKHNTILYVEDIRSVPGHCSDFQLIPYYRWSKMGTSSS